MVSLLATACTCKCETLRPVLEPGQWRWPLIYNHLNAMTIVVQNSLLRPFGFEAGVVA